MGVKIKDIPVLERPRERLIINGVETLSNEDLLAIILGTGSFGISAKELATEILSLIGNIKNLNQLNYETLKKIKGIGKSKACNLFACIELGKRINKSVETIKNIKFTSADIVYKYYKDKIGDKKQECFYAIYLDNYKRIIEEKLLFMGTLNYSLVHPREIYKEAYLTGATAIICIHNHPSGNPLPSTQDYEVTNNLIDVSKVLGIKFLDHIIIGQNNYYSFLENNDINF